MLTVRDEQALAKLHEFIEDNDISCEEYVIQCDVIIKALEKQIPNKAIREEDDEMETDWFRCPVCNIGLGWEHAMKKINYCYNCGQHIDTSEIDFYGENI